MNERMKGKSVIFIKKKERKESTLSNLCDDSRDDLTLLA